MRLNNLDLNKLKCFQAVAEKGGLQEGAKHLNLTPSAVYQSVKKLEDELQKHLFFRSGKKYVLTDEGRALQELFQRFLWDISLFQDKSRIVGDELEGDIRVGLPLHFSKSVFVPLMKKFSLEYPSVRFQLTIAETGRLLRQISAFELDFAITDSDIPPEILAKIERKEVFREELILVCSKGFFKDHEEALKTLKTMKDLPHLDYAKNLPLVQRWYKLQYKRQPKIHLSHSIDNVETMVSALREGLGLGVMPRDFLKDPLLAKELVVVSPHDSVLHNQLYLVQEANYINNTLMKRFLQHLERCLSK